jgi:hypothetical protein
MSAIAARPDQVEPMPVSTPRPAPLPRRTRKLIGAFAMLAFVIFYALALMSLAQGTIQDSSKLVQGLFYLVGGISWILPLMPLIRWMERPDPE